MTPLTAAIPLLPPAFREDMARLWVPEHVARLAERLARGVPAERPLPHFAAECTPPLAGAFEPFRGAQSPQDFARAIEAVGCDGLLLVLGQRRTPATLTDARGIPPTTAELLASATALHHPREELTAAARALAKHAHRSPDQFWGKPSGPSATQNAAALEVVERILAGRTWWNVFGHFQHDTVFEARLPTGHGARWGAAGTKFIGFLEPFDEEKCPSLAEASR